MQPVDNSQFTEEQRAEAYRVESMRHLTRQTKALESIRTVVLTFLILFVVAAAIGLLAVVSSASGL